MAAGKNRPSWRAPLIRYPKTNPRPPTGGVRFGQLPDQFRCTSVARSTGQRCGCPALSGAKQCRYHGGYRHAVPRERKAVGEGFQSTAALRQGRKVFAFVGAQNPGHNPSIIGRGKVASMLKLTEEES